MDAVDGEMKRGLRRADDAAGAGVSSFTITVVLR